MDSESGPAVTPSGGWNPKLAVRNGFGDDGLPTGMIFLGKPFSETKILTLAKAYHDFFEYRYQGPKVLDVDTTDLNIVKKDGDLTVIEKRIEEALEEVMHQPQLPLGGLAAAED